MTENTQDLSNFGYMEKKEAGKLLSIYGTKDDISNLGDGVKVEFNPNSGYVFLVDNDLNTAMINPDSGLLENWYFLSYNGNEGFLGDLLTDLENGNISEEDKEELWGLMNEEQRKKYKSNFSKEITEEE